MKLMTFFFRNHKTSTKGCSSLFSIEDADVLDYKRIDVQGSIYYTILT